MLVLSTEEDDDETGEMDMNNSSARGYSDEDDESGLSKKDVGVLTFFSGICKAFINLTCCSANSY